MRYNTRNIDIPISQLKGFTSSGSVKGEWLDPERTIYGVYSYQTLMVAVFKDLGKAFVNRNRYSVTTSKHQRNIRYGVSKLGYLVDNITAEELAELLKPTKAEARPWAWSYPIGEHK
jgi:hypothetical protein